MSEEDFKAAYLHVYGQYAWHDEAMIAGDRLALESLRDSINKVLAASEPEPHSRQMVFTKDGEGYSLYVALLKDERIHTIALPYQDEIAGEKWDDKNNPYNLIRP
jgi:hypothetical protein